MPAINSKIYSTAQKFVGQSFEKTGLNDKKPQIHSTEMDYQEYQDEIRKLIRFTREGKKLDSGAYHNFFVYGPTGIGKTIITQQIAEEEGCKYHKLEVQKVPVEILQGFPYLVKSDDGKTFAKLAPSTILPPSDSEDVWVLHFDEYNKAGTDKQAAIMNLAMSGELGGSADFDEKLGKSIKYRLPKRTVIIGSGNPREQENIENINMINNMDTATSERWHRTGYLGYNAESWLESFALKPYKFEATELPTRIPSIILNFIIDKTIEAGKQDAPFIIPVYSGSKEGAEGERTTSPRAWTFVADRMNLDMWDEYQESGEGSFIDFWQDPNNQIKHFANQVYEFGVEGHKIVQDVISRFVYFAENRILPQDIVNSYKQVRRRVKTMKDKKGAILYLLLGVAHYIAEGGTIEDEKITAISISTFIQDADINVEDIVAFIQTVDLSKVESATTVHEILFDVSEKYKNAYSGYYYTSKDSI